MSNDGAKRVDDGGWNLNKRKPRKNVPHLWCKACNVEFAYVSTLEKKGYKCKCGGLFSKAAAKKLLQGRGDGQQQHPQDGQQRHGSHQQTQGQGKPPASSLDKLLAALAEVAADKSDSRLSEFSGQAKNMVEQLAKPPEEPAKPITLADLEAKQKSASDTIQHACAQRKKFQSILDGKIAKAEEAAEALVTAEAELAEAIAAHAAAPQQRPPKSTIFFSELLAGGGVEVDFGSLDLSGLDAKEKESLNGQYMALTEELKKLFTGIQQSSELKEKIKQTEALQENARKKRKTGMGPTATPAPPAPPAPPAGAGATEVPTAAAATQAAAAGASTGSPPGASPTSAKEDEAEKKRIAEEEVKAMAEREKAAAKERIRRKAAGEQDGG